MSEIDLIGKNENCLIRSASGGSLYALAAGATDMDIQDTLSAKLAQLNAMLKITCGCGGETFNNWSDEIRDNYLWACSTLADECLQLSNTAV